MLTTSTIKSLEKEKKKYYKYNNGGLVLFSGR